MKRYIRTSTRLGIDYSMFSGTPFKCSTGTPFGNRFLDEEELAYQQKYEHRTGRIVMMSPEQYYEDCALYAFDHFVSINTLKNQRREDQDINDELMELMQNGTKINMCYINKADHGQEGLHRMMAAGDLYGWDTKFPVLVIDKYYE